VSVFKQVVWRSGDWQEATSEDARLESIVAGIGPAAIAAVPEQDIATVIGELERIKLALSARLTAPEAARDNGDGLQWIEAAEVARRWSLPEPYVYELARRRELPSKKLGKYVRFAVRDVQAWADKQDREG
jgi:excisionase family DNA binding protein